MLFSCDYSPNIFLMQVFLLSIEKAVESRFLKKIIKSVEKRTKKWCKVVESGVKYRIEEKGEWDRCPLTKIMARGKAVRTDADGRVYAYD